MIFSKGCLALSLLICTVVYGQDTTFQKRFWVGTSFALHNFQQTSDSGYVMSLKGIPQYSCDRYGFLIKTDKNGQISWEKKFSAGTYIIESDGNAVIQTSDGGYIVATVDYPTGGRTKILVIKTDSLGNVEWSSLYPGLGVSVAECIKQCADMGYIIAGNTTDTVTSQSFGYLLKISNSGSALWGRKFPGEGAELNNLYAVAEIPGQGYIACGSTTTGATIVKTDLAGNDTWFNTYFQSFDGGIQSKFYSLIPIGSSDFILAGDEMRYNFLAGGYTVHPVLMRIDGLGNVQWLKTHDSVWGYQVDLQPTNDGSFVVSGIMTPGNTMMKFDLSGNLIWSKIYYNNAPNVHSCVEANFDSSYSMVFPETAIDGAYTHLIKTDSTGNLTCGEEDFSIVFKDTMAIPVAGPASSACLSQMPITIKMFDIDLMVDEGCETLPPEECLLIPNVFTPNGDGQNEDFTITYCGDEPYHMIIYDRWGLLQFESNSKNVHWDGFTTAGLQAVDGTYYYLLNIGTETYKGFLSLIR